MRHANISRQETFRAVGMILIAFLLFLWGIIINERRRQQVMVQREIELKEALDREKQASAAKSEFLSRMSHDIRTPLNGIIGCLDIAEMPQTTPAQLAENRKKARVAASHLLSLINDVLNMSKLEDGKVELAHEAFDIRSLADDILTLTENRASEAGLGILSTLSADDLRFAVLSDDATAIAKAPGIGKKTAQKLIIELKDKLSLEDAFEKKLAHEQELPVAGGADETGEAVMALTALGYASTDAMRAVRAVEGHETMDVEALLKAALKNLL